MAYIKLNEDGLPGVDGKTTSFLKLGDFKTYPVPTYTDAGRVTYGAKTNWSANAKAALKEIGMSQQGISALTTGGQVTDRKDKAIVNSILATILN